MFGACILVHKKEHNSIWQSPTGRFPNITEFREACASSPNSTQLTPASFSSPKRTNKQNNDTSRSPISTVEKDKYEKYKFALTSFKTGLQETTKRIIEIETNNDNKVASQKGVVCALNFDDDDFFMPPDEAEECPLTKEQKIKNLKETFSKNNKGNINKIIEAEYNESLEVNEKNTLVSLISSYPALETEILNLINTNEELSLEIKEKVIEDLKILYNY